MLKSNLTRRALVASAAAVPAVALPGLASDEDRELFALGFELDQVAADWLRQFKKDRARLAEVEARIEAATGIPRDQRPPSVLPAEYTKHPDLPGAAYWRTADQLWNEMGPTLGPNGEDLGEKIWNEIHERLFPLAERIVTFRPKTIAGLAIVALAASLLCADEWDMSDDWRSFERQMIEVMCAFCGVIPAPEQVHI
jgi:hypothetical protein